MTKGGSFFSILLAATLMFSQSSLAALQCKNKEEAARRAVTDMGNISPSMLGSGGVPDAFRNGTSVMGDKSAQLGAKAAECQRAAQDCTNTCRGELSKTTDPGMVKALTALLKLCQKDHKQKCDKGAEQAASDQQQQQQGQQAAPSGQPQQQSPEEQQQEEEQIVAECPPGLMQSGMSSDGVTPVCGCPDGTVLSSTGGSGDGTIDQAGSGRFGSGVGSGVLSNGGAIPAGAQCIAAGPNIEYGDTTARRINGDRQPAAPSSLTTTRGAAGFVQQPAASKQVFGVVSEFQRSTSALRRLVKENRDPFADDEESEEEELLDDTNYVPPNLVSAVRGRQGRRIAAYFPKPGVGASRAKKALLGNIPVDAQGNAVLPKDIAQIILDPKNHQNPHLVVDAEGQQIAMLIGAPDPLQLCSLPNRIRILEGSGVYGQQKSDELRRQFESRILSYGGEAGLTLLCNTSDNSF